MKDGSLTGADRADGTIPGAKINLRTLGTVPSANEARTLGGQLAQRLLNAAKLRCASGMRLYQGICFDENPRGTTEWNIAGSACWRNGLRSPTLGELLGFERNNYAVQLAGEWTEPERHAGGRSSAWVGSASETGMSWERRRGTKAMPTAASPLPRTSDAGRSVGRLASRGYIGYMRNSILGLMALFALALPAAAAGAPAQGSVGFEPIPLSVAADDFGHVYLSSPLGSTTVYQYSSDGKPLGSFGTFAASSNPFAPRDIATDPAGNLYVDDAPSQTIYVLGPDGSPLRHWATIASGRDLAVATDGSVFVAGPGEVEHYSAAGALLNSWNGAALPGGRFGEIWGLDTSPSGLVYVADSYGNKIDVFTPEGVLVRAWGQYGRARGHFITPYGIAVNAAEEVYVADTVNQRVERFSSTGTLLSQWGGPGRTPGRFYTPTSIAVDPAGYVYVADNGEAYPAEGLARIQKFTADGKFVTQWYDNPNLVPPGPPRLRANVGHRTTRRTATFRFHSRLEGVRYECRLSGKSVPRKHREWRPCSSPKRYTRLRPGPKVFHARADRGSVPGREVTYSWLIVA